MKDAKSDKKKSKISEFIELILDIVEGILDIVDIFN